MKETLIYRQLALPVAVFDHIKDTQRAREARTGIRPSIGETVAGIVLDHKQHQQQNAEREERDHGQSNSRSTSPAILRR